MLMNFTSMLIFMTLMVCSRTPIMMMGIVLCQSILVALYISLNTPNSWLSFVLFLVFSGGLMILFVYITSLASSEILTLPLRLSIMETFLVSVMPLTILYGFTSDNFIGKSLALSKSQSFYKMFYLENLNSMLALITYLLICLLIVVSLVKKDQGTLRTTTR